MSACGAIIGFEDLSVRDGAGVGDSGNAAPQTSDGGAACLTTACESDDDNCAYCGHRCGDASACVDRRCTPVDVASVVAGLWANALCAFARDGEHLYVTLPEPNDAGVWRTNVHEILPTGEVDPNPVVSVDGLASVKDIVVTDDLFYLLGPAEPSSTTDTFLVCTRMGTGCSTLHTLENAGGFAHSGGRFFATLRGDRSVVELPVDPEARPTSIALHSNYFPEDIIGDQGAIYWRELRDTSVDGGALSRILRVATPPDGGFGNVDVLAEMDASATNLAVDDGHVLFGVSGAVASVAHSGGPLHLTPIRGREGTTVLVVGVTTDRWFVFAGTPWSLYEKDRCRDSFLPIAVEKTFKPGRAAAFGDYFYWCTRTTSVNIGSRVPVPHYLRRVAR